VLTDEEGQILGLGYEDRLEAALRRPGGTGMR